MAITISPHGPSQSFTTAPPPPTPTMVTPILGVRDSIPPSSAMRPIPPRHECVRLMPRVGFGPGNLCKIIICARPELPPANRAARAFSALFRELNLFLAVGLVVSVSSFSWVRWYHVFAIKDLTNIRPISLRFHLFAIDPINRRDISLPCVLSYLPIFRRRPD